MNKPSKTFALSSRIYQLLLHTYPTQFRREYGHEMLQLFQDSYIDQSEQSSKIGWGKFWHRMLTDFLGTFLIEHMEVLTMNKLHVCYKY